MKIIRNNWYYIGAVLFVCLAYVMVLWGDAMPFNQRLQVLLLMTMLIHQVEEYVLPGGFPMFWNIASNGEKERFSYYPLDKRNAAIVNVGAWLAYGAAALLPDLYVLGIGVAWVGLAQGIVHAIRLNIKARTFYNPGMATVLLLFYPLGIWYVCYVANHFEITALQWILSFVVTFCITFFLLALPMKIFTPKDDRYAWSEDEMKRYKDRLLNK